MSTRVPAYSGTAVSTDPRLNGAVTLDVSSVYNTTKNLGWLKAKVRIISSTPGNDLNAKLNGVNVNGSVQGFMMSGDSEHSNNVNLLANVTSSSPGRQLHRRLDRHRRRDRHGAHQHRLVQ